MKGEWHIAWQLPLNNILSTPLIPHWIRGLHAYTYMLVGFILPVLYGSWRFILFTFLLGPFIAAYTTHNINEFPAIWRLLSIALCISLIKSPIRKYLHVKTWWLYSLLDRLTEKEIKLQPIKNEFDS